MSLDDATLKGRLIPASKTETLVQALTALSRELQTDDGVVSACLIEAAQRLAAVDAQRREATELCELAWGVIANAGEGNWARESKRWQAAAKRWRGRYGRLLNGGMKGKKKG